MSKYLLVGDIHGDAAIVHRAAQRPEPLIFLGDFLDSFTFSPGQQHLALQAAIQLKEQGRARIILGNHEVSYLNPNERCSGWNALTQALVVPHREAMLRFEPFIWFEKYRVLVTHAGVSQFWWERHGAADIEMVLQKAFRDGDSWFHCAGKARGGPAAFGGPLWLDWQREFQPIPGIRQVVGHSASIAGKARYFKQTCVTKAIRTSDNGDWNIDCLQHEPLGLLYDDEDGSLEPTAI